MHKQYDAGLLNDFGGGNVEWWQDYIRAELALSEEHYESIIAEKDAMLKQIADALQALLDRTDAHFGGIDKSYDWKEQMQARDALKAVEL